MTLGTPLNVTNLSYGDYNYFLLNTKYEQELRIKIIFPNEVGVYNLFDISEYMDNYLREKKNVLASDVSIKEYSNKTIRILFQYRVRYYKTNILELAHWPIYKPKYFYIIIESAEHYDINLGITYTFNNILEYYDNIFYISGAKKLQRVNISLTLKSSELNFIEDMHIVESYKIYGYYIENNECTYPVYNFKVINESDKIYNINFMYDIKLHPIVDLTLKFKCDIYYLNISVNAFENVIIFEENNETKTISNIKANIPYSFFTPIKALETALISLTTKYSNEMPFDYVDIYEYEHKKDLEYRKIREFQIEKEIINKNELITSFKYKNQLSIITNIVFRFIPKYDLDYIKARINTMGGTYDMNDGDIKNFTDIYPECEFLIYIKMSQFQTVKINLKTNI